MLHHHHHHHHDHDRPHDSAPGESGAAWRRALRFGFAGLIVAIAIAAASTTIVSRGEAVVVTRFGNPVRVVAAPGIAFKAPAPIETVSRVNLRIQSLSSGLQDVGTRDGLRVLMQAYVLWRVGETADELRRFLRAVRNEPDLAAIQLRSFTASTLEIAASRFDLSSLVNSDRSRIALGDLEALIRERLEAEVEPSFGIRVQQVGIERLTLPSETLDATVARMSAERLTAAQERKAEGSRLAAEIRSAADRDARIALAEARTAAAETEAEARRQASAIYGASYRANPELYGLLRSLDTLGQIVGDNTRLILRTDAAPFRALVDNPAEPTPPRAAVPPVATPPGAWPQAALPRTAAPEQRP